VTTLIIRMRVKPEKEERFLEIAHTITGAMKDNEPEVRVYGYWRTQEPYEYLMLESYLSASALDFHIAQHEEFRDEFGTLLSEPPEIETLGEFVMGYPDVGCLPLA